MYGRDGICLGLMLEIGFAISVRIVFEKRFEEDLHAFHQAILEPKISRKNVSLSRRKC